MSEIGKIQRTKLGKLIVDFCNDRGRRTFSLQELHDRYQDCQAIGIGGKTPRATVRRILQELRDTKIISFGQKSGHYTLRSIDLSNSEKQDTERLDFSREEPNQKEHIVEIYARSSQWGPYRPKKSLACMA